MKKLHLLIILLSLTGCIKTKNESNSSFKMSKEELTILKSHCESIKNEGDIFALLKSIKSQTQRALLLTGEEHPENHVEEIKKIAEDIDDKTKRVLNLSKEEWTDLRWEHQVRWTINREDFKDLIGTRFKKGFRITESKIESIVLNGQRRNDLKSFIKVKPGYSTLELIYDNLGSSLELCQLQKTLVVTMKVSYRHIKNENVRYFNLTVK